MGQKKFLAYGQKTRELKIPPSTININMTECDLQNSSTKPQMLTTFAVTELVGHLHSIFSVSFSSLFLSLAHILLFWTDTNKYTQCIQIVYQISHGMMKIVGEKPQLFIFVWYKLEFDLFVPLIILLMPCIMSYMKCHFHTHENNKCSHYNHESLPPTPIYHCIMLVQSFLNSPILYPN